MFRAIANSVCDTRDFFYAEQESVMCIEHLWTCC